METRPATTAAWRGIRPLLPYLLGTLVVLPAAVLAAARILGRDADPDLSRARALAAFWQVSIFLSVLLVPYYLNRRRHGNLSPSALLQGAARAGGYILVCLLLSLLLTPRTESDVLLNVINFHFFLASFAFLLASVFALTQALGAAGSLGQALASLLGLAMVGTVFYANPFIEGELVTDAFRRTAIDLCIGLNPVIVALYNFMGVDFFHIKAAYNYSAVGSYPYAYPAWQGVAGLYVLGGSVAVLAAVLAHFLRVVLPRNLLRKKLLLLRESRRERLAGMTADKDRAEAAPVPPPADAAPDLPPAETAPASPPEKGSSILEALFQEKVEAEAVEPDREGTEEEDALIRRRALDLADEAAPSEGPATGDEEGAAPVAAAEEDEPEPRQPAEPYVEPDTTSWMDDADAALHTSADDAGTKGPDAESPGTDSPAGPVPGEEEEPASLEAGTDEEPSAAEDAAAPPEEAEAMEAAAPADEETGEPPPYETQPTTSWEEAEAMEAAAPAGEETGEPPPYETQPTTSWEEAEAMEAAAPAGEETGEPPPYETQATTSWEEAEAVEAAGPASGRPAGHEEAAAQAEEDGSAEKQPEAEDGERDAAMVTSLRLALDDGDEDAAGEEPPATDEEAQAPGDGEAPHPEETRGRKRLDTGLLGSLLAELGEEGESGEEDGGTGGSPDDDEEASAGDGA